MTTQKDKELTQTQIDEGRSLLHDFKNVLDDDFEECAETIAQALATAREEGRDAEWKRVLADLKRCENEAEKVALKHREAGRESAYQRFAGHADFCSFGHIHLAPLEERQKLAYNLNKMREGNLPTNAPEGESDRVNVTLQLKADALAKLNWIMEVCEIDTRRELFDLALNAFHFCVKQSTERKEVGASGHEFIPLAMECLDKARSNWPLPTKEQ